VTAMETAIQEEALQRRYRSYPAYKDSGVEWLGEIPEHWEIKRLRSTVKSCQNGVWGNDPDGLQDIVCVRVADFDRVCFRANIEDPTLRSVEPKVISARGLERGDLLLEKSGGGENQPVGAVVLYDHDVPAVCSNFVARVVLAKGFDSRFMSYLHAALYSLRINTKHIKQSTGIQNLDSSGYLDEAVVLPPRTDEQRSIATFLDRETARIDALVAKKRRLIELLQEQRTALITRAVTKGLDPSVPMTDSGVEWLGEIPEHWEVRRLKFLLTSPLKYGANEAAELDDPDLPRYVRITDIDERDGLRDETFKSLPVKVAEEYLLQEGDVLFARSGATAGKSFLYRRSWGACAYAGYLIRARLDTQQVLPDFVRYFTASTSYWQWLSAAFIQATIQNVSADKYASLLLIKPQYSEQRSISSFLDLETARIDALVYKVLEAIELLNDLRTAVISAAVTGKIDVREEVR